VSSIRRESGIGISRVPGTCVLGHRKCRNPDGGLYGCSHMISGHMDHGIAKGASQCKRGVESPGDLCAMTLRGAKPRQALRLWSCERRGRIDQDLARKANALRAHRGSENREFRVHVHLGTTNSETPTRSCRMVI
jgi:hypothetical protein